MLIAFYKSTRPGLQGLANRVDQPTHCMGGGKHAGRRQVTKSCRGVLLYLPKLLKDGIVAKLFFTDY
ncbi:MAG TPA: hypothetical protein PLE22_00120 [Acidovorax sp.]|nr:hypothetical protein [Acidovorax sp.]